MRALIQRVRHASVRVRGEMSARIETGLTVFIAVGNEDTDADASYIVDKVVNLRIFPDEQGRFDRSALDVRAALLIVSQFTLYADTRRGRRPSFIGAAPPAEAHSRFDDIVERFRYSGLPVETGEFQEMMDVELINDGPVTIWIDSSDRDRPRR